MRNFSVNLNLVQSMIPALLQIVQILFLLLIIKTQIILKNRFSPWNIPNHRNIKSKSTEENPIESNSEIVLRIESARNSSFDFHEKSNNENEDTHESIQNTQGKDYQKPFKYGIGISGFHRITNPSYAYKFRIYWILSYILCFCICTYIIHSLLNNFRFGKPSAIVGFKNIDNVIVPNTVFCPYDLFGDNTVTKHMRKRYSDHFRIPLKEVMNLPFSKMLNLPEVNLTTLWNLYDIDGDHVEIKYQCSSSKSQDCTAVKVDDILTSAGRCVLISDMEFREFHGPINQIEYTLKVFDDSWYILNPYFQVVQMPREENPIFQEKKSGLPGPKFATVTCFSEIIEVVNVNWTHIPCDDKVKVENCISKCMENLIYSKLACSLPFLKSSSFKLCDNAKLFNKSWESLSEILVKKKECKSQCPRKCSESLQFYSCQVNDLRARRGFTCYLKFFETQKLVIEEKERYTATQFLADVGGSLGVFLDINLLTFVEFAEILVDFICHQYLNKNSRCNEVRNFKESSARKSKKIFWSNRITRRNRLLRKKSYVSQSRSFPQLNIGIVGCDRILSERYSRLQKAVWAIAILLSGIICSYHMYTETMNYIYGYPEIKLEIERNETFKYPSITICPFRPYNHYHFFNIYRDEYRDTFNYTGNISDISLSELVKVPDVNISEYWTDTHGINRGMISKIHLDIKNIFESPDNDEMSNISFVKQATIHGQCLTVTITSEIKHHGDSTITCIVMGSFPESTSNLVFQLFLHEECDDVRTINSNLGIPVSVATVGLNALQYRMRKSLNLRNRPCGDAMEVAECRSRCYDSLFQKENISCRLPFMKWNSLKLCESPEEVNRTLEFALSLANAMDDKWCKCLPKCEEYFNILNFNSVTTFPLKSIVFCMQLTNNYIKVSKEYFQDTIFSLFAKLSGSLGLYLGFCVFTIFEIIETLFIIYLRPRK